MDGTQLIAREYPTIWQIVAHGSTGYSHSYIIFFRNMVKAIAQLVLRSESIGAARVVRHR